MASKVLGMGRTAHLMLSQGYLSVVQAVHRSVVRPVRDGLCVHTPMLSKMLWVASSSPSSCGGIRSRGVVGHHMDVNVDLRVHDSYVPCFLFTSEDAASES